MCQEEHKNRKAGGWEDDGLLRDTAGLSLEKVGVWKKLWEGLCWQKVHHYSLPRSATMNFRMQVVLSGSSVGIKKL